MKREDYANKLFVGVEIDDGIYNFAPVMPTTFQDCVDHMDEINNVLGTVCQTVDEMDGNDEIDVYDLLTTFLETLEGTVKCAAGSGMRLKLLGTSYVFASMSSAEDETNA